MRRIVAGSHSHYLICDVNTFLIEYKWWDPAQREIRNGRLSTSGGLDIKYEYDDEYEEELCPTSSSSSYSSSFSALFFLR
jgi:hypothetical protein